MNYDDDDSGDHRLNTKRRDDMSMLASGDSTVSPFVRRIMAGVEALMMAGVLYLVASDQQRKEDMIILKTTSSITAQAVANIPDLTIRMTKAESDVAENKRRIANVEEKVEDLQNKSRLQ